MDKIPALLKTAPVILLRICEVEFWCKSRCINHERGIEHITQRINALLGQKIEDADKYFVLN